MRNFVGRVKLKDEVLVYKKADVEGHVKKVKDRKPYHNV